MISELKLELSSGLNVFTGQTGAGKSILIEALGFLLGARGSLDWLRSGEQRLEVTGVFDAADFSKETLSGLKVQEKTVAVRRELDASGKTRAFIHNQTVNLSVLSEIGDSLIDFHGQHEHQTLLKPSLQLDFLDAFGGLEELREKLGEAYAKWTRLVEEQKSLQLSDEERLRRLDLYRFQVNEIDEVALKAGEEEEFEALLPRLKNAERLKMLSQQAYGLLYDQEGSVQENLLKAERAVEELVRLDAALAPDQDALAQARAQVQDVATRLTAYRDKLEDPDRIDEIHTRLDRIGRLKKKYGATVADILAYRERIATELAWLEDSSARTAELESALNEAQKALAKLCGQAHKSRMAAASKLSEKIAAEIRGLGMAGARLSVSVEMEEDRFGPTGSDAVEFLISPNEGEPLKPLKSIASGGELSRIMLALKTVLARADRVRILVFDEVDTGVGGEVGRAVGKRLADVSRSHQVLCVTHLPQVACWAANHFQVSKDVQGGRTFALVECLEGDRRLEAIARMLGGKEATAVSRKHARELLEECR
ncbi:MAG: DNA repair protein RecN [Elusimicrobia bacterium]|nr:DNA repair protein RecN [Elusimicrobiota bacterium]